MLVRFRINHTGGESEDKTLETDVVAIGRNAKNNNVVLKTEEVSRDHARIVFRAGRPYLSDLGKYGTALNGRMLAKGEDAELARGARIEICGNVLILEDWKTPQSPVLAPLEAGKTSDSIRPFASRLSRMTSDSSDLTLRQSALRSQPESLRNRYTSDLLKDGFKLAQELDAIYRNHITTDPAARKQKLKDALKNDLVKRDDNARLNMLEFLKERFCTKDEVWKSLIRENKDLKAQIGSEETTRAALEKIAAHLVENAPAFQNEADLPGFCENLRQTLAMLLSFVRDFDAELQKSRANEAQSLTASAPLRNTKSLPEFGRSLLDWSNSEESAKARAQLEKILGDLLAHERALQHGYHESLRHGKNHLLKRLEPSELEREVGNKKLKFKFFNIPQKFFAPLLNRQYWRRYKEEFRALQEQERDELLASFDKEFQRAYNGKMAELRAGA